MLAESQAVAYRVIVVQCACGRSAAGGASALWLAGWRFVSLFGREPWKTCLCPFCSEV